MKAKKKIDYSDPKFNDFIPREFARGLRVSLKKQCALYKVAYWHLVGWIRHRYGIDPPNPFGLGKTKPPAKRGRKHDSCFGRALAIEYEERKKVGAMRKEILLILKDKATRGELRYTREKRELSTSAIWSAVKKYR
ncbi:MAG: hypothetical protein ACE14U_04150 [Candidatus Velamenicoccus archaeovorus]